MWLWSIKVKQGKTGDLIHLILQFSAYIQRSLLDKVIFCKSISSIFRILETIKYKTPFLQWRKPTDLTDILACQTGDTFIMIAFHSGVLVLCILITLMLLLTCVLFLLWQVKMSFMKKKPIWNWIWEIEREKIED